MATIQGVSSRAVMARPAAWFRTTCRAALLMALAMACGIVGSRAASAAVVLNEVLYDPAGDDTGAEYVELWNNGDTAESLAGLRVEAGDGARSGSWTAVFVAPDADSIPAHGVYAIDSARLTGAIQNGPDAVRLTRAGVVIDVVGWGDLAAAEFFEGHPAADGASGLSLSRRVDGVDTGDNAADWEPAAPTPNAANHPPYRVTLGSTRAWPEVAWPGDPVAVSATVKHTGREPLGAGEWGVVVSTRSRPSGGPGASAEPWRERARFAGGPLAPAESLGVTLSWIADDAGAFDLQALAWTRPDAENDLGRAGDVPRDSALVSVRIGAGPVAVNEFAFRDAGAGEWVELLALESVPSWGAFALADAAGAPRALVTASGGIPGGGRPGDLRVVAADPARFLARFALPESLLLAVDGGWASLNDTESATSGLAPFADVVRVVGSDAVPSDAVPYAPAWSAGGASVERLAAVLPSTAARTWTESVAPVGGTPGAPNSVSAFPTGRPARPALLAAAARVLRREGIGGRGALVLELGPGVADRSVRLSILDLRGRVRRRLASGERFGAESAVVWDGVDDDGRAVEPGLYVAALEASAAGQPSRRASVTIAVAPRGTAR